MMRSRKGRYAGCILLKIKNCINYYYYYPFDKYIKIFESKILVYLKKKNRFNRHV